MAKMFFSLGFWMTIVLLIALGYAFGYALGADCPGSMNCSDTHTVIASSKWFGRRTMVGRWRFSHTQRLRNIKESGVGEAARAAVVAQNLMRTN